MTFNLDRLFADVICELARAREKHPRDKAIPFTSLRHPSAYTALQRQRTGLAYAYSDDRVTHQRIIECELAESVAAVPADRRAEIVQTIVCLIRAAEDLEATS